MNQAEAKKRIKQLSETINHHNYLYHTLDKPELTDYEFDLFFDELLQLEAQFPELRLKNSPSLRVGGKPVDQFEKKRHQEPMLSLQNTYSPDEIIDFEEKIVNQLKGKSSLEFHCAPKYDGVAIELIYENGELTAAVTRGDGEVGENVITNVRTIQTLPLQLTGRKLPKRIDIRGEILLFKKEFARINGQMEEEGLPTFANPRNAAAGTIRQLDAKIAARRNLRMFCYSLGFVDGMNFSSQAEFETTIAEWGLPVMPIAPKIDAITVSSKGWSLAKICRGHREVIEYYTAIAQVRHQLPFEIDGIVVKVNNVELQQRLGHIARSPRWAFAAKYQPEQEMTVVEDIDVQVGRTGALTPVAKLQPVSVGGVTITNATLHNQDEIDRKDVRIGDWVLIHRAGDVIPEVIKVITEKRPKGTKKFKLPDHCPVCKQGVIQPAGEVIKRCINALCPAVLTNSLKHFVSRNAMNIEKVGSRNIEVFFASGLVATFSDLYKLTQENILSLDRQGEKSSQNIIDSIASSKQTELHRFIYALGIRFVGEQTAKVLAQHYSSIDRFLAATEAELLELRDVGPKVAASIVATLKQKNFQKEVKELINVGITFRNIETRKTSSRFDGRSFVVTGTLPIQRDEVHRIIESHGGQVAKSISKNVNVLIVGEKAGGKLKKAQELGLDIWDWDRLQTEIR